MLLRTRAFVFDKGLINRSRLTNCHRWAIAAPLTMCLHGVGLQPGDPSGSRTRVPDVRGRRTRFGLYDKSRETLDFFSSQFAIGRSKSFTDRDLYRDPLLKFLLTWSTGSLDFSRTLSHTPKPKNPKRKDGAEVITERWITKAMKSE